MLYSLPIEELRGPEYHEVNMTKAFRGYKKLAPKVAML